MYQIQQALALLKGHDGFVERNTGLTNNPRTDLFMINPQGVLSNNRHFIADTRAEYQPNGDGTTEGQALLITGYAMMYMATGEQYYLDKAIYFFDVYIRYFYAGRPVPGAPQRYICNWLANSKEPVLAHYPINRENPTHGGYKSVPLVFVNGEARIPHGAPFWGEYLDTATFAHRGHMTWGAINASVQRIKEDVNGDINWQALYDGFRRVGPEPAEQDAWIDWPAYLGADNYSPVWGGPDARAPTYDAEWITTWAGTKVDIDVGDIVEEGVQLADRGRVKLKDRSINGVYLFNYAVRLPVEHGGYMFGRNEVWHNRPVHTPLLGSVNQMGNAADAEVWFIECCYLLWRITGEARFKQALDSVFFTAHEYTFIDAMDKFFRQTTAASTPFTDGISYDFTYPPGVAIEYGRDANGFIDVQASASSQHFIEQQSVWFRVGPQSKLRVTYGGGGVSGKSLGCRVMLDVSPEKQETQSPTWYGLALPRSKSITPVVRDVPIGSMALLTNPTTGEDYLVADSRAASDYGGCTWGEVFEENVLDGRSATVINAHFPDDNAGFIIGFWLTNDGVVLPKSITYKADADFNIRFLDADEWRWWFMLPATNGEWSTVEISASTARLSSHQPNKESTDPRPSTPNLVAVDQVTILLDDNYPDSNFTYYAVNDIPPLLNPDGWSMTYRMMLQCSEPWAAKVGDCTIIDYRLDSLAYCPGVIPFSNIYDEGTVQIGAWHGMPYPGYQYPMMYAIHRDNSKYSVWLNNQIRFLRDSQIAYSAQVDETGPGCAAYIWNRWDNYKYGPADTWTTFHWGDGKPWAGYQPRAFQAAARTWYELKTRGEPVPQLLIDYVEEWVRFLVRFAEKYDGHTPSEFPTAPNAPVFEEGDLTAHMIGLWLAGSSFAALAGCTVAGLDALIEKCVAELTTAYTVTRIPGKAINGAFSPAPRENSDNGMAFGFYTGEIYRGLAVYMMLRKFGRGHDIYSNTAIPSHEDASLTI